MPDVFLAHTEQLRMIRPNMQLHTDNFSFLTSSCLYSNPHHYNCDCWTGLQNFLCILTTPIVLKLHSVWGGSIVFCSKGCFCCFPLTSSLIETTDKGMLCYFALHFIHHKLILCTHIICRLYVLVS